jgi:hypothetical protein
MSRQRCGCHSKSIRAFFINGMGPCLTAYIQLSLVNSEIRTHWYRPICAPARSKDADNVVHFGNSCCWQGRKRAISFGCIGASIFGVAMLDRATAPLCASRLASIDHFSANASGSVRLRPYLRCGA